MMKGSDRLRALGTSIRWVSVLEAGYRVPTSSKVSEFLGWSEADIEVDVPVKGTSTHFANQIRETVEQLGLLRKTPWTRFSYPKSRSSGIVFCTTSSNPLKDWEDGKWNLLQRLLENQGWSVQRQTEGTLKELEEQLAGAKLVIGVDSGPLHLADYLGVPVLGLYGYSHPDIHGPLGERSKTLYNHPGVSKIEVDSVLRKIHDMSVLG